jgi:rRNA biogenesis protein RRP5
VVIDVSGGKVNLRLAQEGEVGISGDQSLKGSVVTCQIVQIVPGRGLKVRLMTSEGRRIWGLVHLTDISDSWTADPLVAYRVNQVVKAFVLDDPTEVKAKDEAQGQLLIHLSLRPSRVSKALPGPNPEILSVGSLTVGQVVKGFVKVTNTKGCWISLSRDVVARVLIKNLSDGFVQNPEKQFPPGKLVVGRVTDVSDGKVDVSLRTSTLTGSTVRGGLAFKDLKEGQIVKGTVTSLRPFGVFIRLLDSNVSGLCHISNVADTNTTAEDLNKHYKEGDLVRAKIIGLEPDKKRVSFGLKSSLLAGAIELDEDGEQEEEKFPEEAEDEGDYDEGDEGEDEEEEGELGVAEDDDDEPLPSVNVAEDDVPPLPIFSFATTPSTTTAAMEEEEEEEEESDEEDEEENGGAEKVNAKSSRRAKASAKKRAETQLNQKEEQLLDPSRAPESAEDFKRLLASSPDSSYLWIKLMAFHVGITELDKARAVAEQALKTINFREQQEKWNVWIALMNLENLYGTSDSLKQVFDRAKERNDSKKITMELCKMFEASEKFTLAEEAFEAALKSYGTSAKVWYNYALFFYRRKDLEKARAILPRALERLAKYKHLKLIRKMAQAEYTLGTTERGRTIMEGVMSSYPKRVDLWSTYLDMEIKAGTAAGFPESAKATVRRLFERTVHLDLKPRKMKFFFKRYLVFEKEHGDAGSQHHVKALAQSYVDKVNKAT